MPHRGSLGYITVKIVKFGLIRILDRFLMCLIRWLRPVLSLRLRFLHSNSSCMAKMFGNATGWPDCSIAAHSQHVSGISPAIPLFRRVEAIVNWELVRASEASSVGVSHRDALLILPVLLPAAGDFVCQFEGVRPILLCPEHKDLFHVIFLWRQLHVTLILRINQPS